jgi:hypothetical protein
MAEANRAPESPKGKTALVGRMVLVVALVLVLIAAFQWYRLSGELKQGVSLYEAGKYQDAVNVLEPLLPRTLSGFRIRAEAKRTIGLCKAEMASEIALKDRTAEGYQKALKLLEEAKALAGSTQEIERRIAEYTGYLHPPAASTPAAPPAK